MKKSKVFLRALDRIWKGALVCFLAIVLSIPPSGAAADGTTGGDQEPQSTAEHLLDSGAQNAIAILDGDILLGEEEAGADTNSDSSIAEEQENAAGTTNNSLEPDGLASNGAASNEPAPIVAFSEDRVIRINAETLTITAGTKYSDGMLLREATAFDDEGNDLSHLLVVYDSNGLNYQPGEEINAAGIYTITLAVVDEGGEILAWSHRSVQVVMGIMPLASDPANEGWTSTDVRGKQVISFDITINEYLTGWLGNTANGLAAASYFLRHFNGVRTIDIDYAYRFNSFSTSRFYALVYNGTAFNYHDIGSVPIESAWTKQIVPGYTALMLQGTYALNGLNLDVRVIMTPNYKGTVQYDWQISNEGSNNINVGAVFMIDTELQGEDYVPVYSAGTNNGMYIDTAGASARVFFPIVSEANGGPYDYAADRWAVGMSFWDKITNAFGATLNVPRERDRVRSVGDVLLTGVDSAVFFRYLPDALPAGSSRTFVYRVSLGEPDDIIIDPEIYTVSFDSAGGTPVVSQEVEEGTQAVEPVAPTRTGYTFAGWTLGGSPYSFTTPVIADITLVATWNPNTYTVTFDANGGLAPAPPSKTVTFNSAYGTLATTSREGYDFVGWFTAATGGTQVTAATIMTNTSSHTLYAYWTPKGVRVNFNANGGETPNPTFKNVVFDSTYGPLATTERYGYSFAGWYTAATGGTQVTDTTMVSNPLEHTLYARWTPLSVEVTFDANGGLAPVPPSKTVTFDSAYGALAETSRIGYSFVGWFTAATGGTEVTAATTVTRAESHTLYARWSTQTVLVNFNANGGLAPVPPSKNVTFDSAYGALATTERYGYSFNGWFTALVGGTQVTADTMVTNPLTHTLYARWTPLSVEVTFDANGGLAPVPPSKTVTFDSAYGALAETSRIGYSFVGWFTAATGGTEVTAATTVTRAESHTLYARWSTQTVLVNFNANGGLAPVPPSKNVTFDSAYGALATTERYGYSFNGWFTALVGGTQVTADTMVTNPLTHTLYARWTPLSVEVTFDANGGLAPVPPSKTVTFDSAYGALATTERYGYSFAGWYTAATGGTQVTATTTVTNASAHTLYARWTALQFEVTFNANGGVAPVPPSKTVTFDSPYGALAETTREGYVFGGWYTAATGGTLVTPSTMVTRAENHTLFALWEPVDILVTFDANGGNAAYPATKSVTFDTAYGALATTERYGYSFVGWFTAANGGTQVTVSTTVTNPSGHTLYAHWTPLSVEVTFDANGGQAPTPSSKTVTFDSAYGALATTERYGYSFAGWFTAATGGAQVTATTIVTRAEAHTLYARWTPLQIQVTFDANGGITPVPTSKTVTFDSAYGTLAQTSRTGYSFAGWFTAATGGTQVSATTTVTNASAHTLYARWAPEQIRVNFDANGGQTPNPTSKLVTFDSAYGALATTERYGYSFIGWFTAVVGGTQVTDTTIVSNPLLHTLYARWTPLLVEVTFDANGGITPVPTSKTVTFDSAYGTLAQTSRTGYSFAGWFTAATGGTQVAATTTVTRAEAHTLYARWTPLTIEVAFDANGGETPDPQTKNVTFDSTYGALATTERYGYSFDGWFTEADGGDLITDSTVVSNAEAHTLFAQWTPLQIEVSFDANGGQDALPLSKTVTFDSVYEALATTERYGYSFDGWFTEADGGDLITDSTVVSNAEAHTLFAQWTPLQIEVTFDANGGQDALPLSKNVTFDSVYEALATTERYGYSFNGWFTDTANGTQVSATTLVTRAEAHTLYAQWTPLEVKVTFNANGGVAPVPPTKNVTFDSAYGALATTERYGYIFRGWYTQTTGGDQVLATTIVSNAAAHSLFAQWTPRSDFTVTYFGNGNTSGSAPVDSNSPYVFNTAVKVLGQGSLVRDGYSFQGWATSSGGKAVLSDGLSFVITNHIELYAVWSANPPVPVPPPPAPPTIIINNPPPPPAPPVTINNYPPAPPPPPVVIINNPPAPAPPAQQPPPPPPAVPIEREIPPLELPLAAPITNWALLNLIMTLLGFLLVVITLVRVLSSRRNDNRSDEDREERRFNQSQERERSNLDSEREERKRAGRFWLLFSSLLTIIAVVIFLITQDLSGVMTLFDLWTIAHLVIFCAQIFALVAIAMKTKKSDDEREFEREQVVVLPATY